MQIQGPQSRELVRSIVTGGRCRRACGTSRFFPDPVTIGGAPGVAVAHRVLAASSGYEVFLRPEHAAAVWEAVEAAGATPYGVDIIEPVRVETGMVVTDYDYEPHAAHTVRPWPRPGRRPRRRG